MAIFLFQFIRRKLRECQARKAIPTTDDSHLVPEKHTYNKSQRTLNRNEHAGSEAAVPGSHINYLTPEEAAQQKAEIRRRKIRQWKLILGLLLPNFLAAMDVTIVAPAIPLLSSHFNRLSESFNWIVAAYTLTFTTFVPASGQLADIYGRHFALQFEMFWIMIGSVLCAAAQSWSMLLLGRALQGLGAAGIMSLSRIILSDGATLAENAWNNSLLSLISGVSYSIGPVIGGRLVDASWHYIFILPIGVSILAMLVIFFVMRKELVQGSATEAGGSRRLGYITGLAIIDWPGLVMFILGVGCIILAIQWGGTQYAWSSAQVVAPFVVGGILCISFFVYEYLLGPGRAVARLFPQQRPMIPSTLFRKADAILLMIINFSTGISIVSAFYFISYYWQFAEGYSSSKAGVQLLFYLPGLGLGVHSATLLCNKWPRQTYSPLLLGSIVECLGLTLLTYSVYIRNTIMVKIFLAVAGAGTGLRFMPVVLHGAGIWSTCISSMQSLLSFMIPLGETIGISLMGSVFSNKLATFLAQVNARTYGTALPATGIPSLELLDKLPEAVKQDIQNAAAKAVMWSFVAVLPFVGLSLGASVLLGNVWIGKPVRAAKKNSPARGAEKVPIIAKVAGTAALAAYLNAKYHIAHDLNTIRALRTSHSTAFFDDCVERKRILMYHFFEAQVRKQPDSAFLIFEGRTWSYKEFFTAFTRVANWLIDDLNIQIDEVVAINGGNSPEYLMLWFALDAIGAVTSFLNCNITGEGLLHSVRISNTRLLITDDDIKDNVEPCRAELENMGTVRTRSPLVV
ncbi:ProP, Permease major facilitator superfamily [Pyrenophora tritici-repentis]|uniref:ProP, Permease major facilitator superfamily n=1 Tax=Pyrenophora tritici-repentis TaxID=45151 RepID=A0A317ACK4_9PLEO|nr:Major facilitator superfamily transporter MFS-1 [Pyrenophora tritici-repentis]KAF7576529.1 ProP, Permease major facilitator superfamily [Pyrenophora tritici-repentis]KAI1582444.1 ProP Permease of the major facilitator superfamily [Pyrenophora tritici-repentis]